MTAVPAQEPKEADDDADHLGRDASHRLRCGWRADLHADAGLVIRDGIIADIGPVAELKARYPDAAVSGGSGFAITPGFVNAHHHVGLTPLQLGSPDHPLELWFASRIALRDVDLYADTLFSAFEMIERRHHHGPASAQPRAGHAHRHPCCRREGDRRLSRHRHARFLFDGRCATRTGSSTRPTRISSPACRELRPAASAFFQRFTVPLSDQVAVFDELVARHGAATASASSDRAGQSALAVGESARDDRRVAASHRPAGPYACAGDALSEGLCPQAHRRLGAGPLDRLGLLGPHFTIGHASG